MLEPLDKVKAAYPGVSLTSVVDDFGLQRCGPAALVFEDLAGATKMLSGELAQTHLVIAKDKSQAVASNKELGGLFGERAWPPWCENAVVHERLGRGHRGRKV